MPCFGGIRFADLTLKPRLAEHPHRHTNGQFFFLDVAIRNSLRSNNVSAREHFFVPCGDKTSRAVTIHMCKIYDLNAKYAR